MNLEGCTYKAEINYMAKPQGIACRCSDCGWTGMANRLMPIHDCSLTPGDASPAGRCPKCESLAYVDRPDEHQLLAVIRNAAAALKAGSVEEAGRILGLAA